MVLNAPDAGRQGHALAQTLIRCHPRAYPGHLQAELDQLLRCAALALLPCWRPGLRLGCSPSPEACHYAAHQLPRVEQAGQGEQALPALALLRQHIRGLQVWGEQCLCMLTGTAMLLHLLEGSGQSNKACHRQAGTSLKVSAGLNSLTKPTQRHTQRACRL